MSADVEAAGRAATAAAGLGLGADERTVRFYRAAVTCVERDGLAATSVEDVARAAGSSRATLYRTFPGGRDQLIAETVAWEVAAFFTRIEQAVVAEPDVESKLAAGLAFGHLAIADHALLQRLLRTEPEALLSSLSVTTGLVLDAIADYVLDELTVAADEGRLRPGVDLAEAADHLARLFLSYLGSAGRWDLTDPVQVRHLVRTQFLAGVAAP